MSNIAIALVALALGYMVCSRAVQEKGMLRKIGLIIGVLVIAGSCFLLVLKINKMVRYGCFGMGPRKYDTHKKLMREQHPIKKESHPTDHR